MTTVLVAAAALTVVACHTGPVINTGEPPPDPENGPAAPMTPALNRASLVSAFDYYGNSAGQAGYYFTTPSGRWDCAIVPRWKAGCQRSDSPQLALGVAGAPDTVTDKDGESAIPNAILVDRDGDGRFARLERPEFSLISGPAKVLPFGRTLVAGGFRCNVQEQFGVSCLNEWTGKGFTFSAQEWQPRYIEVPADPPS
jgi:hypothetical protein